MAKDSSGQIEQVMQEDRKFPPSESFASQAVIRSIEQYEQLYDRAKNHPNEFWGEIATDEMHWFEPFQSVLEGSGKDVTWFAGGKTNLSYNCLDANIAAGKGDKKRSFGKANPATLKRLLTRNYTLKFASLQMLSKISASGQGMWFQSTCQ